MPFVSRKKYDELVEDQGRVRALESAMEVTNILNTALDKVVDARDRELNEVGGFLQFLATRVPDYEGYVLEYMEFQESSDA